MSYAFKIWLNGPFKPTIVSWLVRLLSVVIFYKYARVGIQAPKQESQNDFRLVFKIRGRVILHIVLRGNV